MVTVSSSYRSVNMRMYCSPNSFCNAYGESGAVAIVSTFGSVGVLPYADEEPA